MDYSSERNHGCRILEYTHRGLTMVSMENEILKISVLADKGADIVELVHKPSDIDFMWKAPGGIRETAKHIPTIASSLGNNLDYYEGGWHESLPCAAPCINSGAELGLHGEVALLPWSFHVERDDADLISVIFSCRTVRFPFHVQKRIVVESNNPVVSIDESLTNESSEVIDFMWGQHPTFGKPFLDSTCRIDIPASEFTVCNNFSSPTSYFQPGYKGKWPLTVSRSGKEIDLSRFPPEAEKSAELLYLKGLNEGWFAITNTGLRLGIGIRWDINIFPYVWYWRVLRGLPGYPWYSRTYNIGLEPWSSYPSDYDLAKQGGALIKINGNERIDTSFKVVLYSGVEKVKRITEQGTIES